MALTHPFQIIWRLMQFHTLMGIKTRRTESVLKHRNPASKSGQLVHDPMFVNAYRPLILRFLAKLAPHRIAA
jgi:hypothetical protein